MDKWISRLAGILLGDEGPLPSTELARLLEVSSRTVKRKIRELDEILQENGAQVHSSRLGYEIQIRDPAEFEAFLKEWTAVTKGLSIDDDAVLKVVELLLLNPYITQDQLADAVFVSRGTLNKMIKDVKQLLEKEKIFLSNRPHYGYYLLGDEMDIRNYMVKVLFRDSAALAEGKLPLCGLCPDYKQFYREVMETLEQSGFAKQGTRTMDLLKYLLVIGVRVKNHRDIRPLGSGAFVSRSSGELAEKLAGILEKHFQIELSESEKKYIGYLIGNGSWDLDDREDYDIGFFEGLFDEFVTEIRDVYQYDFSEDETLRMGLIQHLFTSYSRMYVNAQISNPFIELIKSQYIEAYNYAVLCGRILQDQYHLNVSEDNLAYIAMHFGAAIERRKGEKHYQILVVCESGYGMAELFKARLKNKIQGIDIIDAVSLKDLEKMKLSEDVILIVSSVPVPAKIHKPVILVNPMLPEEDLEHIREYLMDYQNIGEYKKLFSRRLFYPQLEGADRTDVLKQILNRLEKEGVIDEENEKDILHREEISSTEINRHVAVPHCITGAGRQTAFAIATLKKPISWGRGEVTLVFVGMISRSSTINKKVFPMLYRLTMDSRKVERLAKITDYDSFIRELFDGLPVGYEPG